MLQRWIHSFGMSHLTSYRTNTCRYGLRLWCFWISYLIPFTLNFMDFERSALHQGNCANWGLLLLQRILVSVFLHENASAYAALNIQAFFCAWHVQLLPWPPCSPDMPAIEHVWKYVGRLLARTSDKEYDWTLTSYRGHLECCSRAWYSEPL